MLEGKHILVGITGGIAAYKTATIVRLLVKEGASVRVVMTDNAKKFVGPLTFSTLSRNPVLTEFFNPENGQWNSHIDIASWSDLFLIAPATANTIAKMANGIADNLLLTTYLSARCSVMLAPAMDCDMLKHPATVANIQRLKEFGNIIIDPKEGELASGLEGKGRMAEPEDIVGEVKSFFSKKKVDKILNKRLLINAGPTKEPIDPVRFISNHSSGKMGVALADAAADMGFEVTLVLGPVDIMPENKDVKVIKVVTAKEMATTCIGLFSCCDVAILAAAVADFTLQVTENHKIKKEGGFHKIDLVPTIDIADTLGKQKRDDQLLVGFALETDNEIDNAIAKLEHKNMDAVVLNSLNDKGACFGGDTNRIIIIDKLKNIDKFGLESKHDAALNILNKVRQMLNL